MPRYRGKHSGCRPLLRGLPNNEALLQRLRELVVSSGVDTDIELVRVDDADTAERERFLGSPTVRVNGEDVETNADQRTDFGH